MAKQKQDPLDRLTGARRAMNEQRKEEDEAQRAPPKEDEGKPSEPKRTAGRTRH